MVGTEGRREKRRSQEEIERKRGKTQKRKMEVRTVVEEWEIWDEEEEVVKSEEETKKLVPTKFHK